MEEGGVIRGQERLRAMLRPQMLTIVISPETGRQLFSWG